MLGRKKKSRRRRRKKRRRRNKEGRVNRSHQQDAEEAADEHAIQKKGTAMW